VRIRTGNEADAGAVAALWTEAYSGRGDGEGRTAPYDDSELAACARDGVVSVVEEGERVVGVIVFRPPGSAGRAVAREGEAEHSRLAVSAAMRRRGTGRELSRHCIEQAREAGAGAIVLWSRPYQVDAHRLYESLGYRRAPERDSRDADGRRLVFRLGLDAR
jgi:ribosomal protein S18 acetylase RimI-like enzyme